MSRVGARAGRVRRRAAPRLGARRLPLAAGALALATSLASACPRALADEPRERAATGTSRGTPGARGEWGWLVVFPSLAAGSALLAYGLTIECGEQDTGCQRGAGAAIWGGVGLASLGSLLGLAIVQAGRAPAPALPPRSLPSAARPELRLGVRPVRGNGAGPRHALVIQLAGALP